MHNSTFIIQYSSFAAGALYQQMEQATELDAVIRKNLEGLSYAE